MQESDSSQNIAVDGDTIYWAVQSDLHTVDAADSTMTMIWDKNLDGDAFVVDGCLVYHRYTSYRVMRYDPETETDETVSECPGSSGGGFGRRSGHWRRPLWRHGATLGVQDH